MPFFRACSSFWYSVPLLLLCNVVLFSFHVCATYFTTKAFKQLITCNLPLRLHLSNFRLHRCTFCCLDTNVFIHPTFHYLSFLSVFPWPHSFAASTNGSSAGIMKVLSVFLLRHLMMLLTCCWCCTDGTHGTNSVWFTQTTLAVVQITWPQLLEKTQHFCSPLRVVCFVSFC